MPTNETPIEPSTIENIDFGLYEWVEGLNLSTITNDGFKKSPVVWLGTERAFQIKNNKELRDSVGKLKLPIITVNRDSMTKDPEFKGIFQAHAFENPDDSKKVVFTRREQQAHILEHLYRGQQYDKYRNENGKEYSPKCCKQIAFGRCVNNPGWIKKYIKE